MEDPSVFEQVARGDLYVEMGRLRKIMANPNTPASVRLEYLKQLAQMGKVSKPEQTGAGGGPGFQININLPDNTRMNLAQNKVIEHES